MQKIYAMQVAMSSLANRSGLPIFGSLDVESPRFLIGEKGLDFESFFIQL